MNYDEHLEIRARASESEAAHLRHRITVIGEQLRTTERRSEALLEWADSLAGALFLTLVDSGAHGAECSGVLRDFRVWLETDWSHG